MNEFAKALDQAVEAKADCVARASAASASLGAELTLSIAREAGLPHTAKLLANSAVLVDHILENIAKDLGVKDIEAKASLFESQVVRDMVLRVVSDIAVSEVAAEGNRREDKARGIVREFRPGAQSLPTQPITLVLGDDDGD